jgi:inner membrane protein
VVAILTLLYGYLYLTLQSEAHALLAGSTGLFATLALLMFITRNIDWHKLELNR